jgi:hypothetical protein
MERLLIILAITLNIAGAINWFGCGFNLLTGLHLALVISLIIDLIKVSITININNNINNGE